MEKYKSDLDLLKKLGRVPNLKTNKRLEQLLWRFYKKRICDVYVTNVFPFVKLGGMSQSISQTLANKTARCFTVKELAIVRPRIVLVLGKTAQFALEKAGAYKTYQCYSLPHPAARIGGLDAHAKEWEKILPDTVNA